MKSDNFLKIENCNKAKCKTCVFGRTPINLSQERLNEITNYLVTGESSHICHNTNKTCYGGLELQAKVFFAIGAIPEPTVKSFLQTAAKTLNFDDGK